jgi:hypothetical protein
MMKAVVKESIHVALDGIHVKKYQVGDIIEANSEFEKAYIQALVMNEKAEMIYATKPTKKVEAEEE